jgi:hypothetical protein
MAIWLYATPGGLADGLIGGLFALPYRAGRHLARVVFTGSSVRDPVAYRVAPLIGVATEILVLTFVWLVIARLVRRVRKQPPGGEKQPS